MTTRISTSQTYDNSRSHIAEAQAKQADSSDQASTLKSLTRPSQGPGDWVRAANLKDDLSARETILKNAGLAQHYLSATENALSSLQENVQRAHELAVAASNPLQLNSAAAKAYLGEVENLYEAAIQTVNSRYGDRTLLAGFKSNVNAFDHEGNYQGDKGEMKIEVDKGLELSMNVSGEKAIQGEGMVKGVNILETLQRLMTGLKTNDTELIRSTLEPLLAGNDQLSLMRADIGGRMNQIEHAVNAGTDAKIRETDSVSKLEDADAIKVFSDLARDQTVLRAAVSTTQKILTGIPVDILYK